MDFALNPPFSPKRLHVRSPWIPVPAIEEQFDVIEYLGGAKLKEFIGKLILKPVKQRIEDIAVMMAGSMAFTASKSMQDAAFGATAFTGATPLYVGLWTAAIDDTVVGNTASEAAYTSYARLSLTNNTTIFAAGTGTTTYTKTFPSDATKSFVTSTGSTATVTYMAVLNGNAGSSADKGYAWCSVTSTTINSGDTPQIAQNAVTVVQD
jgi:hypothetical protein